MLDPRLTTTSRDIVFFVNLRDLRGFVVPVVSLRECISVKTIEARRANIMRKLHLRSVSDLVRYAIRNKIVQP